MDKANESDVPELLHGDAGVTERIEIGGKVARGSIWSISGKLAVLMASLVGTPFTLRLLDPTEFGLWSLMVTIMTYLVIVDLGMSTASTKFAGEAYVREQPQTEARVIWTAAGIASAVGAFCALILALFASRIATLLSVPQDLHRTAVAVLRLVSVTLVLRALTSVFNTPSLVRLRWKGLTLATAGPAVALALLIPLCLAVTDGGVVTMAMLALVAGFFALVSNALIAIRLQPNLLSVHMDGTFVRAMSGYGLTLTATALVVLPLATADRFLLAHYWSPAVVAPYAVALTFAGALSVVPVAAADPLFPAFVRMIGAKDWTALAILYGQASRALFLILTPAAMFLAFLGAPLLRLYAGPQYGPRSIDPFYILLGGIVVNAMAYIPYNFLLAVGRLKTVLRIHLLQAIPYLVAASWLITRHQAVGAATAWTARVLCDGVFLFFAVGRDHRLKQNLRQLIQPGSTLLLVGLGSCLTVLAALQSGLPGRVTSVCVLAFVYVTVVFRRILSATERDVVLERLRRTARWRAA